MIALQARSGTGLLLCDIAGEAQEGRRGGTIDRLLTSIRIMPDAKKDPRNISYIWPTWALHLRTTLALYRAIEVITTTYTMHSRLIDGLWTLLSRQTQSLEPTCQRGLAQIGVCMCKVTRKTGHGHTCGTRPQVPLTAWSQRVTGAGRLCVAPTWRLRRRRLCGRRLEIRV